MRIGWIDFSDRERSKINALLQLLEEKTNLDELGLAPIRDGFANLFFPGISTLVNRAKYFLIVPYALKDLEKSPGGNLSERLRDIERECGQKLVNDEDNASIIGKNSLKHGAWVAQSPSEMYWGPLRYYGIFRKDNLSLAGCLRLLAACPPPARQHRRTREDEEGSLDDPDAGRGGALALWDSALPYEKNWRKNLRVGLEQKEAEFLKTRILDKGRNSMLAYILKENITQIEDCKNFLDLKKIIHLFPSDMQADYRLARAFSLFVLVLRTAFALVISKDQDEEALQWQKENGSKMAHLAAVDLDAIFARLNLSSTESRGELKAFLMAAKEAVTLKDMSALKGIVAKREQAIKQMPKSQKAEPILDWRGRYALNYRFGNSLNVCRDIFAGMNQKGKANA